MGIELFFYHLASILHKIIAYLCLLVRTGEPEYFDAFICACDSDAHFVKQMLSQLEGEQYGLKLCYLPRDLTVGSSSYTALCFLIRERCNKMIAVLSPNFNESDQCDFLLKFAHSLEPSK